MRLGTMTVTRSVSTCQEVTTALVSRDSFWRATTQPALVYTQGLIRYDPLLFCVHVRIINF